MEDLATFTARKGEKLADGTAVSTVLLFLHENATKNDNRSLTATRMEFTKVFCKFTQGKDKKKADSVAVFVSCCSFMKTPPTTTSIVAQVQE